MTEVNGYFVLTKKEYDHLKMVDAKSKEFEDTIKEMKSEKKDMQSTISDQEKTIKNLSKDLAKAKAEIEELKTTNENQTNTIKNLRSENKKLSDAMKAAKEAKKVAEEELKKVKKELSHVKAINNRNSSNSGFPTSQTKINQTKLNTRHNIPNSRTTTTKPKGGQKNHKKAAAPIPTQDQITEVRTFDFEKPPVSKDGSPAVKTGKYIKHYTLGFVIIPNCIETDIPIWRDTVTGKEFHAPIPPELNGTVSYGPEVQSMILALTNIVNAPMNKTRTFIRGITQGLVDPSEAYIAKLQKRSAEGLEDFMTDLRNQLIMQPLVYWDDTVIMVNGKRCCLRFYGNEDIAYFTAHAHKNKQGIIEDDILTVLSSGCKVMHDHLTINYNKELFSYMNLECVEHLLRDALKCADDTKHEEWKQFLDLVRKAIRDRNKLIKEGVTSFDKDYIDSFKAKLEDLLSAIEKKNLESKEDYEGKAFERTLIKRIRDYFDPYFAWLYDFSLPTTNNLSERSLRGVKSHMKASGQFESVLFASYYAIIRSYIETCRRNGINEVEAITRLCQGRPYTVAEIFGEKKEIA